MIHEKYKITPRNKGLKHDRLNKTFILCAVKLVSNQINPHFTLADSLHAVASIFVGKFNKSLESTFEDTFQTQNIVFTNTARSALGLICDVVRPDITKKIGIPAFVCAVVATPFLARGYEIEWIETDQNGLIDVKDFEAKATNIGHLFLVLVCLGGISAEK